MSSMIDNGMVTIEIPTRTTDPEERRAMAEALAAILETQPQEEVIVEEPPAQPERKRLPRYILAKRIDVAFRDWVIAQVQTPKRIVRWLSWWIALPWRIGSFLSVILSRKVDAETLLERDTTCNDCEQRYFFVRRSGRTSSHCAACKCPSWKLSELRTKNQLRGWKCPLRKFDEPYSNDAQAETLERLGYEKNAVLNVIGGGCTGCGCGKAGK